MINQTNRNGESLNSQKNQALKLAYYIVTKCNSIGFPVNNMQLQKILYLLFGRFYMEFGSELFLDDFVAWRFGPVVKDVYFHFNRYISAPITETFTIDLASEFSDKEIQFIDHEVEALADKSIWELIKASQSDPWEKTYCNGIGEGDQISREQIKMYLKKEQK